MVRRSARLARQVREDIASMDELSCALLLVSRTVSPFTDRMALALIVIGLVEEQEHLRQVLQELSVRHDPHHQGPNYLLLVFESSLR